MIDMIRESQLSEPNSLMFDDRVVLITGAGRGIGREHARYFAARGAVVIVNDNGASLHGAGGDDHHVADRVVAEIVAAGGRAVSACCDIVDVKAVQQMVSSTVAAYGRLDVVIHNASVYAPLGTFAEARVEDLDRITRVNVHGGWNVLQAAWSPMLSQGYGRIVITGSGAGFFGRRRDHAYSIAKAGLMTLTKLLATEGEAYGIRVNLIGPVAWTDNSKEQGIPPLMEQFAPPVLVSHVVAALAHEGCPVNGEMFHCGGGFVARVFVGETRGTVFPVGAMTAEGVLSSLHQIMDTEGFSVPANSDRSGAHLSASIASANPAFAEALAAVKAARRLK